MQHHQMSTETTNSLTPHWVSFIRHCAAPNLRALERFFDFLEVREQAQIRAHFVGSGAQRCERGENIYVYFAGVSLRGYGVGEGKAREGCY